jgi:hypothetical protein
MRMKSRRDTPSQNRDLGELEPEIVSMVVVKPRNLLVATTAGRRNHAPRHRGARAFALVAKHHAPGQEKADWNGEVGCYFSDESLTWSPGRIIEPDPRGWYCYTAIDFVEKHLLLAYVAGQQSPGKHLSASRVTRIPLADLRETP